MWKGSHGDNGLWDVKIWTNGKDSSAERIRRRISGTRSHQENTNVKLTLMPIGR